MKKYLVLGMMLVMVFAIHIPRASAVSQVFTFMNGQGFDPSYSITKPRYAFLMDGSGWDNKLNAATTLASVLGLDNSTTPTTITVTSGLPATDVCSNIEGVQTVIPQGMSADGSGNCATPQTVTQSPVLGTPVVVPTEALMMIAPNTSLPNPAAVTLETQDEATRGYSLEHRAFYLIPTQQRTMESLTAHFAPINIGQSESIILKHLSATVNGLDTNDLSNLGFKNTDGTFLPTSVNGNTITFDGSYQISSLQTFSVALVGNISSSNIGKSFTVTFSDIQLIGATTNVALGTPMFPITGLGMTITNAN